MSQPLYDGRNTVDAVQMAGTAPPGAKHLSPDRTDISTIPASKL
jgi:hypothetical protein